MSELSHARTLCISIESPPVVVAGFISNPLNLPKWAKAFCKSVSRRGNDWLVETPQGPVTVHFASPNPHGVVDHTVALASGKEVYVPMRVVANGKGSEVLFTLFRSPGMSEQQFDEDTAMVKEDLQALKQIMEHQGA
jgi:hypothetical protein